MNTEEILRLDLDCGLTDNKTYIRNKEIRKLDTENWICITEIIETNYTKLERVQVDFDQAKIEYIGLCSCFFYFYSLFWKLIQK